MLVLCSSNKACFRRCSCARRAALRISAQQETFPRQATTRRGRRRKSECCRAPAATAALTSLQTALGPVVAQDCITAVVAAGAAYVWVRFFDWMASRGLLSQVSSLAVQTDQIYDLRFEAVQNLSRKLVHISSGPLFVLTWPFFSAEPTAKFCAAVVPLINGVRLALVGAGIVNSPNTVKAVSRTQDRTELLRGPLYYVVIMTAATMVFWRQSPVGMMVISLMCGGDGLADIVGRKFGSAKLPFNRTKSWAGSLAMFAGGAAMSTGFVALFTHLDYFPGSAQAMLPAILATSLVAAVVESLPVNQLVDDNFSVPAVAALMGHFMLHSLR